MWFPTLIECFLEFFFQQTLHGCREVCLDLRQRKEEEWRPLCLNLVWLANTAIDQTLILSLDSAFSFSTCDFPWKWAKRNAWPPENTVSCTPRWLPLSPCYRVCAICGAAGRKSQDCPAFPALVSKVQRENSSRKGGDFQKTHQIFLAMSLVES